jgi:hypothetical protein
MSRSSEPDFEGASMDDEGLLGGLGFAGSLDGSSALRPVPTQPKFDETLIDDSEARLNKSSTSARLKRFSIGAENLSS